MQKRQHALDITMSPLASEALLCLRSLFFNKHHERWKQTLLSLSRLASACNGTSLGDTGAMPVLSLFIFVFDWISEKKASNSRTITSLTAVQTKWHIEIGPRIAYLFGVHMQRKILHFFLIEFPEKQVSNSRTFTSLKPVQTNCLPF